MSDQKAIEDSTGLSKSQLSSLTDTAVAQAERISAQVARAINVAMKLSAEDSKHSRSEDSASDHIQRKYLRTIPRPTTPAPAKCITISAFENIVDEAFDRSGDKHTMKACLEGVILSVRKNAADVCTMQIVESTSCSVPRKRSRTMTRPSMTDSTQVVDANPNRVIQQSSPIKRSKTC